MDNKKFDTLIDLIINENEEQARELFHEIVVEKSRQIYENIMDEEMMENAEEETVEEGMGGMEPGMEEGEEMVGEVGDLLDEINAEESGVTETEDDEEVFDLEGGDEEGEEAGEGEVEDAVIRIEDKLDQLMAEFEEIMAGKGEEEMGGEEEAAGAEEEMAGEEGAEEEMMEASDDEEDDEEDVTEALEEAVQLQKVSVTHGDDGAQKKSPGLQNSGQAGMDSKPVKFSGAAESVPTSPKGPSNAYSKGETQVPGAGKFKNAPGSKGADLGKAPAPVKSQASGVNTKSPVAK